MQLDSNVVDLLLSRLLRNLMGPVTPTTSGIKLINKFSQETNNTIAQQALTLVGGRRGQDGIGNNFHACRYTSAFRAY